MGIQGLLPQLKSITAKAHVSKFCGKRAAVDAYVLLHRGAYTCAREIVEGEPGAERCTEYCMGRIQMLLGAGVVPVVVFDGGQLPNKDDEEKNRARSRAEHRAKAQALWQQGNKTAAYECYQRAVDISPAVAKGFIDALQQRGVEFIVAPYEADAQIAYLALNGLVDVVITEDSDLLAYGCPRVFFKMDKCGEGEEIELKNLAHARELSFIGFTHDMFQEMCILAGCDFVKALPGIGIKKAHQQIRQRKSFVKVIKNLRFSGTSVPPDYEKRVQRAIWTFQHQRIYCPQRKAVVHLHEVKGGHLEHGALVPSAAELLDGEEDFLGPQLSDEIAQAIAAGHLDPITKQPFGLPADRQPCTAPQQQQEDGSQQQGKRSAHVQSSLRQILEGLDGGSSQDVQQQRRRQQQQQGQQQAKGKAPPTSTSGNTLANYGFLRASGSAMKRFKPHFSQAPAAVDELCARQEECTAAAAEPAGPDQQRQAFLRMLQAADAQQPLSAGVHNGVAAGGAGQAATHAPGQPSVALAAIRPGISGLLTKLGTNLHEPGLDELLRATAGAGEAAAAAEEGREQQQAASRFELQQSPTIGNLMSGSKEAVHSSPLRGSTLDASSALQLVQQVTPGFYGVPSSEEQDGMLPMPEAGSPRVAFEERLSLGADEAADGAAGAAISSLGHVKAFAQEAKAAVDRITVQAVRDSGMSTLPHVQPPPYLQRRQQQQQSSAAALKRPFNVPRKLAGADKENGADSKRIRKEAAQPHHVGNLFSQFACK